MKKIILASRMFLIFIKEFFTTKVLKGSKWRYKKAILEHFLFASFQFIFRTNKSRDKLYTKYKSKKAIIKNNIGIFDINLYDSSLLQTMEISELHLKKWILENEDKDYFIDIGSCFGIYSIFSLKKDLKI